MLVTHTIVDLRAALDELRQDGKTIGLVPTMGYLHAGHMALVDTAHEHCDAVVLTIFVNPTQFAPNEDLDRYPRDLPRDLAACERHGVDVVFAPPVSEMYPEPMDTSVTVKSLSDVLIGRQRPGHFQGVATVVTKLFNIAQPHKAFFGEKDFQQLAVIRRMTRDLSSRVEIVGVPTVREADGLAYSSRNALLVPEDRVAAVVVPNALRRAVDMAVEGERDAIRLRDAITALIESAPRAQLASIDICDAQSLEPLAVLGDRQAVLLITVRFGNVLLIDQMTVGGFS